MDGSVAIRIGTSGWSYPSWRPGFYPDGLQPAEFLAFYAERFETVELNSTGYRLPSEDQFRRWAEAVPDGFEFAVKLPLTRLDRVTPFLERAHALGDRLGPVRVVVEGAARRRARLVRRRIGAARGAARVGLPPRVVGRGRGLVRVGDPDAEPFRYIRLREPPYSDDELQAIAATLRDPAYVYIRHEDEPTAPATAERLRALARA